MEHPKDKEAVTAPTAVCTLCKTQSPYWFTKDAYPYYRCPRCDFIFVFPSPADTTSVYGEEYFTGGEGGFGYVDYDADKAAMKSAFIEYLKIMQASLGTTGKLLDVGAASGYFLDLARSKGWDVEGIEISSYGAELGRKKGIPMHTGTLLSYPSKPESFDAVSMLDVIEHVQDPEAEIQKAASLLKVGGVLIINTPDTGSFIARLLGTNWHQYIPPEHIAMFNAKNLSQILTRNGFVVEKVTCIGKEFTIQYVLEILERHIRIPGIKSISAFIQSTPLGRLAIPINLFDNIFVSAKRV
jgi:2-polyprenyl-3-methyl-5-hydroxy-6-metoxy-1,4-benzoquinol methylase/DNA-directed RNA polymerase subunit RPC12/RpoP